MLRDLRKEFNNKYNVDKIIGSGDVEYIAKYNDNTAQQLIETKQELDKVSREKDVAERNYKDTYASWHKSSDENNQMHKEIEDLKSQLKNLRNERDCVTQSNQMLKAQLQLLKELVGKVRGGLGSKGVDELRKAAQDVRE